ncbi:hypothetical protein C1O33_05225 [Staphylococcus schleiferi]|nr:hypothetical protein [Staphylococcus schleiferi]NHB70503.1 hypothetical protein [Staphylococcus sp. 191]
MIGIILIIVISAIVTIYLGITKDVNIIASVDAQKVPAHLKTKLIYLFIVMLWLTSLSLILTIALIETHLFISLILFVISLLLMVSFYIYYYKISQ